jgi:flagellar biosynthesis/type III secretory pathway chaperone
MGAADPLDALLTELDLELMHVKQMVGLLEEEQRELIAGRVERLEAIASEKLAQSRALELYASRRAALLSAQGFSADARGLMACAHSAGVRGQVLRDAWVRVAETATEARQLNEQNGALIRLRLASVDGRLAHLEAAVGGATVYAADGRTSGVPPQRAFGQV